MSRAISLAVVAAFAAVSVLDAQPTTAVPKVDEATYKAFFTAGHDERIRVFNELSPEQKASLMRTHLVRWIAANESTLTQEQGDVLAEALALITPEVYQRPQSPQMQARVKDIGQRAETALGEARALQAFRIQAAYVPEVKSVGQ